MKRLRRRNVVAARVALCVLAGLLSSGGATAAEMGESNAQAARRWGLIGTWRVDCDRPVGVKWGAYSYLVRAGTLYHDRDFGRYRDSHAIESAVIRPNGSIELIVTFKNVRPPQTRQFAFIKDSRGRYRTWYNRNLATNRFTIRNGRFTSNGRRTRWLERCR